MYGTITDDFSQGMSIFIQVSFNIQINKYTYKAPATPPINSPYTDKFIRPG